MSWQIPQMIPDTLTPEIERQLSEARPTPEPGEDISVSDFRVIMKVRKENGPSWGRFTAALFDLMNARCDDAAARLSAYPVAPDRAAASPMPDAPLDDMDKIAARIMHGIDFDGSRYDANFFDREIGSRTRLQLLAVHAAILRYRWEHNAVPPSLYDLRLGSLAVDRFTGKPLIYAVVDSQHYTLSSAGPLKRDAKGDALSGGARVPISL